MVASAVTARRSAEPLLKTRILSAIAMAPPALLAAWWGGYAFAILVAIAAAVMCWEWHTITTRSFGWSGKAAALGCALAVLLTVSAPDLALIMIIGAAIASTALAPGHIERQRLWTGLGALYIGVPSVLLVWLRQDPAAGLETVFWLLMLVWATDIGAYAAGKTIGGPKLMPAVSPKKTWAGLAGGMAAAGLVGWAVAAALSSPHPAWIVAGSALLAVVAQAGDLFESWVKRKFHVKDSSTIIPGHGGVLDRVDGLLTAAAAIAFAAWASGAAVLYWQ